MLTLINKLLNSESDLVQAAAKLAELLEIGITKTTLKKDIEEHPDYPSLLSVSDVYSNYDIANISLKVKADDLGELPTPFIAQLTSTQNSIYFSAVRRVDDTVEYFDNERYSWLKTSVAEFKKMMTGVVLLAEADEHAGEPDFDRLRHTEKTSKLFRDLGIFSIPVLVCFFCFFRLIQTDGNAWLPVLYTLSFLLGTLLCILLLWYEIDVYNPALRQICAGSAKINCAAVIQSEQSKIAGISWSTIGFVYFVGGVINLISGSLTDIQTLTVLSVFSVCATPYILYSIYFQWRIAKQWCVLCLAIQGVITIQGLIVVFAGWFQLPFTAGFPFSQMAPVSIIYLIPFLAVTLLMPALLTVKRGKSILGSLQRLKHNPQIFEALLARQKSADSTSEKLGIILGNPNATNKIIKVCNPYCGPCARAHKPLESLLENNPDLQLQIIFTATAEMNDPRRLPVGHLLAIADSGNQVDIKNAMDDWYLNDRKDYSEFSSKHPLTVELDSQNEKIEAMRAWCNENAIAFTPTIFVNGNQLPDMYSIADLKYFLST